MRIKQITSSLALLSASALPAYSYAESYLLDRAANLPRYNGSLSAGGVALYGSVDSGINVIRSGDAASTLRLQSGGEHTTKLGLYGRENISADLSVEFNHESGLYGDTGKLQDSKSMFNRESWVGLKSRQFGTLRFGKQLASALPLFVDVFGAVETNSVYSWVGGGASQGTAGIGYNSDLGAGSMAAPSRVARAITYTTPRRYGVEAQFMMATKDQGAANAVGSPNIVNRGGVLSYAAGHVYLAGSYNQAWSTPSEAEGIAAVRNDSSGLAAIYDDGDLVLSSSVMQLSSRRADNASARVYTLGSIVRHARHHYRASLVYREVLGRARNASPGQGSSALGLMLGYDYEISKRTALYARFGVLNNRGASTIVINGNPLPLMSDGQTPQSGLRTTSFSLGMAHQF
ncbi:MULTISPECIES: porin [unclassified Undibacterium]|uniref:porin n=1 Tax=unclassified Undibacterium TaxID=2630295 RepID=UPI002AC96116|nr:MULTISPECIES: porin [unclassified Undibacterium]MEB0138856.1 porin [Undibacterium sp. CCC2.1]MEB0172282.1 porin [Undibacterium sp. CCC1.1]MEB0176101.1 porin [Undibacterium sp. CCC3.4]MEB0215938.1 porin [Undibacterium sp. 5I2]WPX44758.1 porin [Undibacterium sp. CCC3.4]